MVAVDDEIEEGENAVFMAVSEMALSAGDDVVIPVSVFQGDGDDFVAGEMPVSLTFAAGSNSSDVIMVYTSDDDVNEENGTISARLFQDDMSPPRWSMVGAPATVSVMDNDLGEGEDDGTTDALGQVWVSIPFSADDNTVVGESEQEVQRDLIMLFHASPAISANWSVEFEVIEHGPGDFIVNEAMPQRGTLTFRDDPANVIMEAGDRSERVYMRGVEDDNEYDGFGSATLRLLNAPEGYVIDPERASVTYTFVDNDPLPAGSPNVAFNSATYSVDEDAGMFNAEIMLSKVSRRQVFVDWRTRGGPGTEHGTHYRGGQPVQTVAFEPGETTRTISVEIFDNEARGDLGFTMSLENPVFAELASPNSASVTIRDNEPDSHCEMRVAASPAEITEGDAFQFDVFCSAGFTGGPSVPFFLTEEGGDHLDAGASPDCVGADTSCSVSDVSGGVAQVRYSPDPAANAFLKTVDDDKDEGDSTVKVCAKGFTHDSNVYYSDLNGAGCATITVLDNDEPVSASPFIEISPLLTRAEEGGTAAITVSLSASASKPVGVRYTASNISASDDDYTGASGVLTFTPGETVKTFTVAITDDIEYETDESFRITISDPFNAYLGGERIATVFVPINDTPPTVGFSGNASVTEGMPAILTLSADKDFQEETAVRVAITGSVGDFLLGEEPDSAVFSAGSNTAKFIIPTRDDDEVEEDGSFTAAIGKDAVNNRRWRVDRFKARDTVAVADNDLPLIRAFFRGTGEEGGSLIYGVRTEDGEAEALNAAYTFPYSLVESGAGNYIAPEDELNPPDLTIPSGGSVRELTVSLLSEDGYQGGSDVVFTILGAPEGYEINPERQSVATQIIDTVRAVDSGLPVVGFLPAPGGRVHIFRFGEGDGKVTLTVEATPAPEEQAVVNLALKHGTNREIGDATQGEDFTLSEQVLTFAPGETTKTVDVTIIDDNQYEGGEGQRHEVIAIELDDPVNSVTSGLNRRATILINDDDKEVSIHADDTDIVEGEGLLFTVTPRPDITLTSGEFVFLETGSGGANHYFAYDSGGTCADCATPTSTGARLLTFSSALFERPGGSSGAYTSNSAHPFFQTDDDLSREGASIVTVRLDGSSSLPAGYTVSQSAGEVQFTVRDNEIIPYEAPAAGFSAGSLHS